MKVTVKLAGEKEIILEPDKTRSVSIDISETGKIEILSYVMPDFYQTPLAGPWINEIADAAGFKEEESSY